MSRHLIAVDLGRPASLDFLAERTKRFMEIDSHYLEYWPHTLQMRANFVVATILFLSSEDSEGWGIEELHPLLKDFYHATEHVHDLIAPGPPWADVGRAAYAFRQDFDAAAIEACGWDCQGESVDRWSEVRPLLAARLSRTGFAQDRLIAIAHAISAECHRIDAGYRDGRIVGPQRLMTAPGIVPPWADPPPIGGTEPPSLLAAREAGESDSTAQEDIEQEAARGEAAFDDFVWPTPGGEATYASAWDSAPASPPFPCPEAVSPGGQAEDTKAALAILGSIWRLLAGGGGSDPAEPAEAGFASILDSLDGRSGWGRQDDVRFAEAFRIAESFIEEAKSQTIGLAYLVDQDLPIARRIAGRWPNVRSIVASRTAPPVIIDALAFSIVHGKGKDGQETSQGANSGPDEGCDFTPTPRQMKLLAFLDRQPKPITAAKAISGAGYSRNNSDCRTDLAILKGAGLVANPRYGDWAILPAGRATIGQTKQTKADNPAGQSGLPSVA